MADNFGGIFIGFLVIVLIAIYFVPTFIAYKRRHAYRHVILGINIALGATGFGWVVAFVWAVWPSEKSLADPVIGNVTGLGMRNTGDTMGSVTYGTGRGFQDEREMHEEVMRRRNSVDGRAPGSYDRR